MIWLPVRTAPFGKRVQYAINVEGHLVLCVGRRIKRDDFDDEKPQHIGVQQLEEHSGNYWAGGGEDELSEHREADVLGWMPLPGLPTERVR